MHRPQFQIFREKCNYCTLVYAVFADMQMSNVLGCKKNTLRRQFYGQRINDAVPMRFSYTCHPILTAEYLHTKS